jgi:hypothetical protein
MRWPHTVINALSAAWFLDSTAKLVIFVPEDAQKFANCEKLTTLSRRSECRRCASYYEESRD